MLDDKDIKKLIVAQKEVFATSKEIEHLIDIVATKEELGKIDKKLDKIATKEDVKNLNKQLSSISDDLKRSNKLETRVADIENVLNMSVVKK